MLDRDNIDARLEAGKLVAFHANVIADGIERHGQAQTAMILRALADLIEEADLQPDTRVLN